MTKAYGISPAFNATNSWYPESHGPGYWSRARSYEHNNGISKAHFEFKKGEIDMLLDINKRELRFCVVGKKEKGEAKLYQLPKQTQGWIPHLIAEHKGIQFRIAKIPIELYGIAYFEDIFQEKDK